MTDKLKNALINIDWDSPEKCFTSIANLLLGECVIRNGNKRYAIVEIEFYLYSKNHRDYITYPRDIEAGRWFFHQSGVDLTFKSNDISIKKDTKGKEIITLGSHPQFGGILIRGIYKLSPIKEEERYIFGPQKCVNELWDDFNALVSATDEYPIIVEATPKDNIKISNLIRCKRCININEYRIKKIKEWSERIGVKLFDREIQDYKVEMFDNSDAQRYRFFNLQNEEDPYTFQKIPASSRPKK